MKHLMLSNSPIPVVLDDDVFDRVSKYNYFYTGVPEKKSGSIQRNLPRIGSGNQRKVPIAQDVLQVYDSIIDHIDRDPFNNQRSNLRKATWSQNAANVAKRKGSKSKYKGVFFHAATGKWRVRVIFKHREHNGGLHVLEIDAAKKANELMKKLHGEFAVLNDV